jgi:hypothetical protein
VRQKNSRLEGTSRLRENSVYALNTAEISLNASVVTIPQDAQRPDFSPARARRAETRLIPGKAAASKMR